MLEPEPGQIPKTASGSKCSSKVSSNCGGNGGKGGKEPWACFNCETWNTG